MKSSKADENVLGTVIGISFLIGCVIYIGYVYSVEYRQRNLVEECYRKTEGKIIRYFDRGKSDAGNGRTIEYSYKVNEIRYSRTVFTQKLFPECDESITEACAAKRFWVIFSCKEPSASLINLNIEIQERSDSLFTLDVEQFQ